MLEPRDNNAKADEDVLAKEVDEIRRREALAKEMGGEERIRRQHGNGRLTVRERISTWLMRTAFMKSGSGRQGEL